MGYFGLKVPHPPPHLPLEGGGKDSGRIALISFINEERGVEWSFVMHDEEGYLEVITRGFADRDNSLNMAKAIARTMRTRRIKKAVIDHRNLEGVSGTTLDIYNRPKLFRLIGLILGIRIAEIIKPEHFEHFGFLETVCHNRGHQLSIFQDKEKALAWLLSS